MGNVVLEITMSLDGFIAGPKVSTEHPLGEGGQRLHAWMSGAKTDAEADILDETVASSGAVIVGRRTYDTAIDKGWDGVNPFQAPAFLVSAGAPVEVVDGFTVVTDGVASAVRQARAVAGEKNVWVMGGARIAQQCLRAGLVDEVRLHIAPVLFGAGTRLFERIGNERIELEPTRVLETPGAVHLWFRISR